MQHALLEVLPWWHIRDPFSMFSHALGALVSLVAAVMLVQRARRQGRDVWAQGSLLIFGCSMALAFTASALFHAFIRPPEHLVLLKKLDHAAIFLMIAGTGTAVFGALPVRRMQKAGFIGVLWIVTVAALVLKMVVWPMPLWLTATIYLIVGWTMLLGFFGAGGSVCRDQVRPMVMSALIFTVSAVVFATERPILWPGIIEGHEVFHFLVLLGAGFLYGFIYTQCTVPNAFAGEVADVPIRVEVETLQVERSIAS